MTCLIERASCAGCGNAAFTPIFRAPNHRRHSTQEWQLVRCYGCGLVRVDPRPTRAAIGQYYPGDYAYHNGDPLGRFTARYYALFRALREVPRGARVLDVGCGGGSYLRFLHARGYSVAGVEPDARVAAKLRAEGFPVMLGLHESASAVFNVVTFWWTLEHSHDPLADLREAARVLKPHGRLIVGVQNFASLGRRLFGPHWRHLDLPTHLYHFEPPTLRWLLRRAQFRYIRIRQDCLAGDAVPSATSRWFGRSWEGAIPTLLGLPCDLAAWSLRRSGLMTAYARKATEVRDARAH